MNGLNFLDSLFHRQIDISFNSVFRKSYVFSEAVINHLNLDVELKGHDSCVNCLEWNQAGNLLVSGSDDLKINIWNPFQKSLLQTVQTKHHNNIFSIKFVPGTNDSIIASAAADSEIYVYDINKNVYLHEIHSHRNRVKRLATAQSVPFLFWSCGEDGLVLQHDIRCSPEKVTQLLLNYKGTGVNASEAKCLALNQIRTELLAVGNNDPYARVYDRRMLKQSSFTRTGASINNTSTSRALQEYSLENYQDTPLTIYTPGHLPSRIAEYQKRMKTLSITFLAFNQDGNELLVNLGGEQLYLFDLAGDNGFKFDSFRESLKINESEEESLSNGLKKKYKLSPKAEELKAKANMSFEQENYIEAIEYYNVAIQLSSESPILYGNRAAALMKRNWDGDYYVAMLDCYSALSLDKMHLKSHFRLVRCLYELKWYHEARECLDLFEKRFPEYANTNACEVLAEDINKQLKKFNLKKEKPSTPTTDEDSVNEYDEFVTKKSKRNAESSETCSESENDETQFSQKKRNEIIMTNYLNAKLNACDLKSRYCGHCNVSTDIKEACFFGDNFIGAGSDDGSFFIWDKKTTNVVRVLKGDESIVNCLQVHPFENMLATSGIDPLVRIWTPRFDEELIDEVDRERVVVNVKEASLNNQRQMNSHPFEFLLLNFAQSQNSQDDRGGTGSGQESAACRPS